MRVLGVRRMPNNNVSDHAGMQDNTFTTHLDKSASSLSRLKEGFSNSARLALPACARLAPRDLFHLEPRDLPSAFLGLTDNNNSNTLRKPRAPLHRGAMNTYARVHYSTGVTLLVAAVDEVVLERGENDKTAVLTVEGLTARSTTARRFAVRLDSVTAASRRASFL
jgi:hypothetical protein